MPNQKLHAHKLNNLLFIRGIIFFVKFIVKKSGPQKLMTYESTFFPDRKTPAAIKIQNLEAAAVFYSIFSHRQFNRSYTAILALLAIAVEAVIILLFNTKGKIFLMIYFC